MHGSFKKMLKESIHESQKCQRNWDLSKQLPEEDKKLIIEKFAPKWRLRPIIFGEKTKINLIKVER